jgi:hypothetical protein
MYVYILNFFLENNFLPNIDYKIFNQINYPKLTDITISKII